MWNFKFSSNLRKCNTIPGKYITPKDEKHFEIKRRLVTQAIQKGHSTAAKFISLMNLHQALHYSSWTLYTQKLEAVVGAFLKQNLRETANELTSYMPETGQITNPRIDKLFEISAVLDGSWRTPVWTSCDGAADVCSDQIGKVLDVIIKCPKCYEVKQNITQKE